MTEKRFEYKNHKVFDNLTEEEHSSNMVSVNVLNQLAEENEQLKIQIDDVTNESIGYEEQIEKLLKKNEQLKKEIKSILNLIDEHKEKWFKKQREAEQGKGWGNSTRYLCYQVALTHLRKEISEND